MEAPASRAPATPARELQIAAEVIRQEAQVLERLATSLDENFCRAIDLLRDCSANVIVAGMGKAGLIGRKIAATLASTGTCAHFVHPAEAVHGDLGRIRPEDVLLLLSQSGTTAEILNILPSLESAAARIIAITGSPDSPLGRAADVVLHTHADSEACPLDLAPSTSTTAMLALGDALALTLSELRGFRAEDFARFHPGGSLGRKLSNVEDQMRTLDVCRIASAEQTVRDVLVTCGQPGRRTGAIMLVDKRGCLKGIFTDSDLVRLFECKQESLIDGPIIHAMTASPQHVLVGTRLSTAVEMMSEGKLSELPVVDGEGRPVGLLDITDLVPASPQTAQSIRPANESDANAFRIRVFDNQATQET